MLNDYVLHSHTFRCHHAVKDIEDYVQEAIKHGYRIYGVSDHVFLPGVHHPNIRGDHSLLDEYINEFNRCKNLYGTQIRMYLGFECEYSESFKNYYESLLRDRGFDYLICGQHMGFDENHVDYGYFTDSIENQEKGLYKYRDDIISAIKSGLFLYIAHPDIFFTYARRVDSVYQQVTKEIINAAIEYDVPLEININGLLREKVKNGIEYIEYPADYFWKEAAKTKVKIVYGGDFHDPKQFSNKELMGKAEDLVKRCGVQLANIDEVYNNYHSRLEKLLLKNK